MNNKHPHLDRILRVIDYIHSHSDQDLSLDQLADVAAMSRFHWHRVFTAVMGGSPASVIRMVRLNKASIFLVRTDMPIGDIATRVGYTNERSFARAFKDGFALTPAAFRKCGRIEQTTFPESGDTTMYDVTIETNDGFRLAALSHRGDYADGSAAFQKVATIMSTGGHWSHTRGMAGVYYDDPAVTAVEDLRSHAGVIWAGGDIPGGLEDVTLAGGRYAVLHLKGPYAGLAAAYQYLYGPWLVETQKDLRDAPSFELYLNDPTDTAPADLLTDVYMPLA